MARLRTHNTRRRRIKLTTVQRLVRVIKRYVTNSTRGYLFDLPKGVSGEDETVTVSFYPVVPADCIILKKTITAPKTEDDPPQNL